MSLPPGATPGLNTPCPTLVTWPHSLASDWSPGPALASDWLMERILTFSPSRVRHLLMVLGMDDLSRLHMEVPWPLIGQSTPISGLWLVSLWMSEDMAQSSGSKGGELASPTTPSSPTGLIQGCYWLIVRIPVLSLADTEWEHHVSSGSQSQVWVPFDRLGSENNCKDNLLELFIPKVCSLMELYYCCYCYWHFILIIFKTKTNFSLYDKNWLNELFVVAFGIFSKTLKLPSLILWNGPIMSI